MKTDFYNQGQSLIKIIIVSVIAGVIIGGLYLYLSKKIPEMPEIAEKPTKEIAEPKKEIVVPPEGKIEREGMGVSCKREVTKRGVTCGGDFYNDYCENFADGTGYSDMMQCRASTGSSCSSLVTVNRTFCSYGCQNGICLSSSGESTPSPEITPESEPKPEESIIKKCSDGTPNMECSTSQPLYCQNFKLVDACMTCGCPGGKVCQQDNTCAQTDLGKKVYILKNGNPEEKLDLLFIPSNISNFSTLRFKINDILYKRGTNINGEPMISLFTVEPFKSYKSKFNVAYVNKNIDEDLFGCYKESADPNKPPKLNYYYLCNNSKIKKEYKIFKPDYIIVIFNKPGYTSSGGEIQYLNINLESSNRFANLSWTFVHEFGHQLGLADEYVTTGTPSRRCGTAVDSTCFENYEKALDYYPNLDTLGCPKWCQSYDLNKDVILMRENSECGAIKNQRDCRTIPGGASCTWFNLKHPFFNAHCVSTQGASNIGINCEGNTMCVFGGDHGQLAFNPGGNSIMSGGTEFNKPSKDHLESILNCCYPRKETNSCQSFRNQFQNIPSSTSILPDIRKALNKIVSCP